MVEESGPHLWKELHNISSDLSLDYKIDKMYLIFKELRRIQGIESMCDCTSSINIIVEELLLHNNNNLNFIDFSIFTWVLHNEVNFKLGKKFFPLDNFFINKI